MRKIIFNITVFLLFINPLFSQFKIDPIRVGEPLTKQSILNSESYLNWGVSQFRINEIHKSFQGSGVKICICDTGIPDHSYYKERIVSSVNVTGRDSIDRDGHATHVGGIIYEVAPKAELIFIKILVNGEGSVEWIEKGIYECAALGADVINLSLGSPQNFLQVEQIIKQVTNEGIIVVAAAGNDGNNEIDNINYPAAQKETICVGSINQKMLVSYFSSSGKNGDVCAAGEQVVSTWLNDKYMTLSGTSMATPFVSGVAALFIESARTNDIDYTPEMFRTYLNGNTFDILPLSFDRFSFEGATDPVAMIEKFIFDLPREKKEAAAPMSFKVFLFLIPSLIFLLSLLMIYVARKK